MKATKKVSYSNPTKDTMKMDYEKTKTKKRLGRTITKTTKATRTVDYKNQKLTGSGTKTKTVVGKNKNKAKKKNLTLRKISQLI